MDLFAQSRVCVKQPFCRCSHSAFIFVIESVRKRFSDSPKEEDFFWGGRGAWTRADKPIVTRHKQVSGRLKPMEMSKRKTSSSCRDSITAVSITHTSHTHTHTHKRKVREWAVAGLILPKTLAQPGGQVDGLSEQSAGQRYHTYSRKMATKKLNM